MRFDERTMTPRAWILLIGSLASFGVLVVLGIFLYEQWSFDPHEARTREGTEPSNPFMKVRIPGIDRPPTVDAARSMIGPEERVIGFVVAGRARAYRLDALRHRTRHVINDVVGEIPLSVSYCDIDECVRAYTNPAGGGPLGVSIAGLFEGREMILEVDRKLYFQRTGEPFEPSAGRSLLPLDRFEPTLTTWGSWKRDHPDTDVYEGVR